MVDGPKENFFNATESVKTSVIKFSSTDSVFVSSAVSTHRASMDGGPDGSSITPQRTTQNFELTPAKHETNCPKNDVLKTQAGVLKKSLAAKNLADVSRKLACLPTIAMSCTHYETSLIKTLIN